MARISESHLEVRRSSIKVETETRIRCTICQYSRLLKEGEDIPKECPSCGGTGGRPIYRKSLIEKLSPRGTFRIGREK